MNQAKPTLFTAFGCKECQYWISNRTCILYSFSKADINVGATINGIRQLSLRFPCDYAPKAR